MSLNQLLKFHPILKTKIWGGEKLINRLYKKSKSKNIGESWEISDIEDDLSVVSNGNLSGRTLRSLVVEYKEELLGNKVYKQFGKKFPLLIKFIDAKRPLSIQLHPGDKLAKKRHNCLGKTEMWYVVQADEGASLIVGFKKDTSKEEYIRHLKNDTLVEILNQEQVKDGDAYFIPSGTVHSIGAGVLLAEIQQTSEITYRIYDWNRKDETGNYRTLHTEQALDAIDYKAKQNYKTNYKKIPNQTVQIVSCPYFTTEILKLNPETPLILDNSQKDSFVIFICVKGEVTLNHKKQFESLSLGQTILCPASVKKITITALQNAEILTVYIKDE